MLDLPDRLAATQPLNVIDYDGKSYRISNFRRHGSTGSRFFENYRAPLIALGALEVRELGDAKVTVVSARRMTEVIKMLWSRADYNLCEGEREIPREYYL